MSRTQPCPRCAARVPQGARFCQDCGAAMFRPRPAAWLLIGALALVLVAGGSLAFLNAAQTRGEAAPAADLSEIPGLGPMPGWLAAADRAVRQEYVWAAAHIEELQYIPCYCGCGMDPFNHADNAACYFNRDEDGNIIGYDNHAYG